MTEFVLRPEEKEAIKIFIRLIEKECDEHDCGGDCENCPLSTICSVCREPGFGLADCLDNWLRECESK